MTYNYGIKIIMDKQSTILKKESDGGGPPYISMLYVEHTNKLNRLTRNSINYFIP